MVKFLVDTNIWIEITRRIATKSSDSKFLDFILANHYQIYISDVTFSELWAGQSMANLKAIEQLGEVINECKVLYSELETTKLTGEIMRESKGTVSFADARIAATAITGDLKLLTLNRRDFVGIKDLKFVEPSEL